ncbi:polysaccharide deacetylase family protein [Ruminiclostridium papyrosolvens]|uniref:cellulase n=1 Tax=Ruminiclostridium papyrosolvens C7 TaxID=1330534 RepID=U4R561_9FIRM|nr:polysaccharide deacetylase family protein [Ruminiclostridium papyrosolvens]EPR13741.1 polysaccharide deacetylase [Ruminiclostridium papyrosolvens C7]
MFNLRKALKGLLAVSLVAASILVMNPVSKAADTVKYGDVNNDGVVDSIDYATVKAYLLGKGTIANLTAADTNFDKTVDAIDFANLKKFLLGSITLPVGTPPITGKVVALTFDDGPDVTLTPKVLDKLDKYHVPATFMMIGQKINDSTASVVKRIISSGSEIGNHSWAYDSMSGMSYSAIKKSVDDTTAAIIKYSGTTPKFFRAPNLATGGSMFDAIDLTFVQGVTCNDWTQSTTAQQRADAILAGARDGAIFLMHDVQPLPHPTPEALDIIIPKLQSEGYTFVTLSDLFKIKGVTLSPTDNKIYTYVP